MTIYRLTKTKYQDTAFAGIGAMRSAGRWHRAGVPVVYASDTPAGALLETVAHAEAASLLSHAYALFTVGLERSRHLLLLEPGMWPADWRAPVARLHAAHRDAVVRGPGLSGASGAQCHRTSAVQLSHQSATPPLPRVGD